MDPDPAIFVIDLQAATKFEKQFEKKFFCLLVLFENNYQKSKRSHKTVGSKVFLTLCLMLEGSGSGYGVGFGSIHLSMDQNPDPGGPKTCGSGFGSGPEHWLFIIIYSSKVVRQ